MLLNSTAAGMPRVSARLQPAAGDRHAHPARPGRCAGAVDVIDREQLDNQLVREPQGSVPLHARRVGDQYQRPLHRRQRHPHPRAGRQPRGDPGRQRAGVGYLQFRQLPQRQPQFRRSGNAQARRSGARAGQFLVRFRCAGRRGGLRHQGPGRLSQRRQAQLRRPEVRLRGRLERPVRRCHRRVRRRALERHGGGESPPGSGSAEPGRQP